MRARDEGWKYAKRSGHRNEELACERLKTDAAFRRTTAARLGIGPIVSVEVGGLRETSVPSVGGGMTKSKTDLCVRDGAGRMANISIKKSPGGQVYLIGADRFFLAVKHHGIPLPASVQRGFNLMFSNAPDIEEIVRAHPIRPTFTRYQTRKNRLVWATLELYNPAIAHDTLAWLKRHAGDIARICFGRGLARERSDWADFVWYLNLLPEQEEEGSSMDTIVSVEDIAALSARNASDATFPGSRNGGSTIQLPFGFLQWHQSQLQFHHGLPKIAGMLQARHR